MKKKFDVIVVGAGPAGATAALCLAKAGLNVVLLERGEYPGAKNVSGGVLYSRVLETLIPKFWEEAPVERYITRRIITFLSPESSLSIDFKTSHFGQPPYNGFTILRPKFDCWYASKAQEAGVFLVPETVVDSLIQEGGKVVGVRTRREQGDLYADVIIAADGANSLLAKQAGLRQDFAPAKMVLGVKEVISLSSRTIAERFNLSGEEGTANEFVGAFLGTVCGGGFLYTNKESVSVGIVAPLSLLVREQIKPYELLDQLKHHPCLEPLLKGGVVREYSAHLIPETGVKCFTKLYTDGILVVGDAAGLVLVSGLFLEGMNFAIASGIAAAEAVKKARESGDFSHRALSCYQHLLEQGFVGKDLRKFQRAAKFMRNARFHTVYPAWLCHTMERFLTVDTQPRKKLGNIAREELRRERISLKQFIQDILQGGGASLW